MIATLPFNLRGLRDRAILLMGYAEGEVLRSDILNLDLWRKDTRYSVGWMEIEDDGAVLFFQGRTGCRKVEIARGPSDPPYPVHAPEDWLHFANIGFGAPSVGRPVTTCVSLMPPLR